MILHIDRLYKEDRQTVGVGRVVDKKKVLHTFHTLELPWVNNERYISCIPKGRYVTVKRHSPQFQHHFHLLDVPDRTYILIHAGNFYWDTRGCILAGNGLADIDGDGYRDVTHSRQAMAELNEILPEKFETVIVEPQDLTV